MIPAWHSKAKLSPGLLFKEQLSRYNFIRCILSCYFAACFSGRSSEKKQQLIFYDLLTKGIN